MECEKKISNASDNSDLKEEIRFKFIRGNECETRLNILKVYM